MGAVINTMACMLTSSQLRSGGMDGSATIDDLKDFGSRKNWQHNLLKSAREYAEMTTRYYRDYLKDYKVKKFYNMS
ncbi:hypothetical protein [Mucilaginibacter ginkgonis]|uniref:Uncharacterized protein n=1 Tax=Mucilaginibacter ginkgonis TaxID=2682091 RepID=A0A6I4HUJ9_9SPHI|nr:hypothetical protein [Mucilaginibacter ginkgonis]QQL50220.1 hypothetical protein GO620_001845 [Mucilaginibacter ginkgonis]